MNAEPTPSLVVLTGASRGLGAALARQLLGPGLTLLCVSRHVDNELAALARASGTHLEQWVQDLSDPVEAAERLGLWLHSLHAPALASATLINNAGMLPAALPLHGLDAQAIARTLSVNLSTPLALTSVFLRQTQAWVDAGWRGPRKVLNVSSGLGQRAMAAQTAYCASKAGLDHATRCLALEQAGPLGARLVSLAPGVIDTDMQAQLRSGDPHAFPDQSGFAALHAKGQLSSSAEAARRLLAYLERPDFGAQAVDAARA